MNDTVQSIIQGVVVPACSLLATGFATWLITKLKTRSDVIDKKLDKNTEVTVAAATDQALGFKDIGQWRYKVNERFARQEERLRMVEDRLNAVHGRVERIPTESQYDYHREPITERMRTEQPEPDDYPGLDPEFKPRRRKK